MSAQEMKSPSIEGLWFFRNESETAQFFLWRSTSLLIYSAQRCRAENVIDPTPFRLLPQVTTMPDDETDDTSTIVAPPITLEVVKYSKVY